MPNAANRVFGSIDGNFDRSAGAVSRISEDTYILSCLYFSYTHPVPSFVLTGPPSAEVIFYQPLRAIPCRIKVGTLSYVS